jgi:integrase/recombinase XerC
VTSRHIEAYIDSVAARTSQATASNHYRALQQFFKFLLLEEEIGSDPFAELSPPKVASKPVPAIPDDAPSKLLAVCKGPGLNALRDTRSSQCSLMPACALPSCQA